MNLQYGDIVRTVTSNNFWLLGELFFVICGDGDGVLGERNHALCWKLGSNKKPVKNGAYEIPWTNIDPEFRQDSFLEHVKENVSKLIKDRAMLDRKIENAERVMKNTAVPVEHELMSFDEELNRG